MTMVENWNCGRAICLVLLTVGLGASRSCAESLEASTVKAFDGYVKASEVLANQELDGKKTFLWIDTLPPAERAASYAALQRGETVVQRFAGCGSPHCADIPDGLIHDWIGTVFIPGVSIAQTLAALQDYDRDTEYYRPQVIKAKLLAREGDHFRVFLRLKQTHVLTVVLDTEYDIQYQPLEGGRATSRSYSTRIAEVENAGLRQEHVNAPGDDHGFLWRLYSYWRFYESDGGVYVQCNAISLTRDIPTGFDWLISPYIENIPRESLRFTLSATRSAVINKFQGAAEQTKP